MASNIVGTIPVTGSQIIAKGIRDNFVAAKTEIENLQNTTAKLNNPVQFGSVENYTNIDTSGTIRLTGDATTWDDLKGGIATAVTSGPGVSLVSAEQALAYVTTANTLDYAWIGFQLEHKWKRGSLIYPHLHWEQTQTNSPNWVMSYRWQSSGELKDTVWKYYKCNTGVFTYVSGTLNQISHGAGITPPENYRISDGIQIRLIRDTTNTSGLFSGADPNNAICNVTSFDIHIESDGLGSNTQYNKD